MPSPRILLAVCNRRPIETICYQSPFGAIVGHSSAAALSPWEKTKKGRVKKRRGRPQSTDAHAGISYKEAGVQCFVWKKRDETQTRRGELFRRRIAREKFCTEQLEA